MTSSVKTKNAATPAIADIFKGDKPYLIRFVTDKSRHASTQAYIKFMRPRCLQMREIDSVDACPVTDDTSPKGNEVHKPA